MRDMEREKFEGSWKRAFDDAEVTPSDKVWANIELDLEKARGGDLKRRLLFYQMLAAASVVLAMTIGGIGYYYSFRADQTTGTTLAAAQDNNNQDSEHNEAPGNNVTLAPDEAATGPIEGTPSAEKESISKSGLTAQSETATNHSVEDDNGIVNREQQVAAKSNKQNFTAETVDRALVRGNGGETAEQSQPGSPWFTTEMDKAPAAALPLAVNDRALTPLYTPRPVQLNLEQQAEEVDPVVAMMAKLALREREVQDESSQKDKDRDHNDENLWTSVGFAAGSFNTVNTSSSPSPSYSTAMAALTAPIVDQETKANGYSYSMGVNVGTRISERWVLQGGVNYLTQASEYIANNIVMDAPGSYSQQKFRAASTNELMMADASDLSQKLVYSAPYSVNNNMRYLSIPMQAGYLLVNKTLGLQLNAGIATDLFLQNTISAESDQIAKTSQPAGSDSPYRAVNLSGLFGTEVSYRFGDHYRVALNPGIRYPFNTIYKSELGLRSSPLTFDVGLRFRYIFR